MSVSVVGGGDGGGGGGGGASSLLKMGLGTAIGDDCSREVIRIEVISGLCLKYF